MDNNARIRAANFNPIFLIEEREKVGLTILFTWEIFMLSHGAADAHGCRPGLTSSRGWPRKSFYLRAVWDRAHERDPCNCGAIYIWAPILMNKPLRPWTIRGLTGLDQPKIWQWYTHSLKNSNYFDHWTRPFSARVETSRSAGQENLRWIRSWSQAVVWKAIKRRKFLNICLKSVRHVG